MLPANCDHEPAKLIQQNDKFVLYYSCDKDNIGESYNGAKAYYSTYNLQFNCITKDNYIDLKTKSGILLYDVKEQNNKLYFLYAKNYLTDNELTIEDIKHIR